MQQRLDEEFELLDDSVEYNEMYNPELGAQIVHAKEQFRHHRRTEMLARGNAKPDKN